LALVNVRYVTVSICETSRSETSYHPACGPSVPCRAPHPPPSCRLANHAQRATPYSSHGHQRYRMPVLPLVFPEFRGGISLKPSPTPPGTASVSRCRPGPPGPALMRPSRRWRPILSLTHLAILEMPNKIGNNLVIKAAQASRSGPMCPPASAAASSRGACERGRFGRRLLVSDGCLAQCDADR
jgi:hypothetical protein